MNAASSITNTPVTVKPLRFSFCSAERRIMDEPLLNSISNRVALADFMIGDVYPPIALSICLKTLRDWDNVGSTITDMEPSLSNDL